KRSELWKNGIKSHKECKKLAFEFVEQTFDRLVDEALAAGSDFTYEGHFTNEATWDIPLRFKEAGYDIQLIFFGLRDTDLSEMRVVARSREGGHYVDPMTVASNFFGNLEKLNKHFRMFNSVQIIDTSEAAHEVLTVLQEGIPMSAVDSAILPGWFVQGLPDITAVIRKTGSGS
ncbi:MAG TPA: zeta toxin family protein, partial [Chitinophagaceae bacterium]|nr:zeta toxin family protein [Chitinophagaceae bacterium]